MGAHWSIFFFGKVGVNKGISECKPCSWRFYNPPAHTCMTTIIFPHFFWLRRLSSIQDQGSVAPFGHEALPCRKFHGFPWPVCPVNHANGKFPTYSQGPSAILGLPTFGPSAGEGPIRYPPYVCLSVCLYVCMSVTKINFVNFFKIGSYNFF